MKRKIPILIVLIFVLTAVTLLTACSPRQAEQKLEQFEDAAENRLDATEDAISSAIQDAVPTPTAAPGMLTAEDATAIAVEHAGLSGQQVLRLKTQYEIDDGVPHYDVEFYHNGVEYDYEIHAETGNILSFDRDL